MRETPINCNDTLNCLETRVDASARHLHLLACTRPDPAHYRVHVGERLLVLELALCGHR
jgi:hypothetical protein